MRVLDLRCCCCSTEGWGLSEPGAGLCARDGLQSGPTLQQSQDHHSHNLRQGNPRTSSLLSIYRPLGVKKTQGSFIFGDMTHFTYSFFLRPLFFSPGRSFSALSSVLYLCFMSNILYSIVSNTSLSLPLSFFLPFPPSGVYVSAVPQFGVHPFPGRVSQRHQAPEPAGGPWDGCPQVVWFREVSLGQYSLSS